MILTVIRSEMIGSLMIQLTEIIHDSEATYLLQAYQYKSVTARCINMYEVTYGSSDKERAVCHYDDWRIKSEDELKSIFYGVEEDYGVNLELKAS